jgi:trimeric autotransporter adhesin
VSGLDGTVTAIVIAKDGTLYAGGCFSVAGGHPVRNVARWDGNSWSAVGADTSIVPDF